MDPLQTASVQQTEHALRLKHPELTPKQIERFMQVLRELRGDPSFENAVEQAEKGNLHVAQGIWRQICEDRKRRRDEASKEQAEAARNLAATLFVENAAEGLRWYREATQLDPDNREGWLGLGEVAQATSTLEEAKTAYRRYIILTRKAGDEREVVVGLGGLGDVLVAEGNLPAACQVYEQDLAIAKERFTNKLDMFSIGEFVKNVGSELNIRSSHRRMSLPEVQDTGNLMNGLQGYDQSHEDFMSTCVRCRKSTDAATPRSRR